MENLDEDKFGTGKEDKSINGKIDSMSKMVEDIKAFDEYNKPTDVSDGNVFANHLTTNYLLRQTPSSLKEDAKTVMSTWDTWFFSLIELLDKIDSKKKGLSPVVPVPPPETT